MYNFNKIFKRKKDHKSKFNYKEIFKRFKKDNFNKKIELELSIKTWMILNFNKRIQVKENLLITMIYDLKYIII